MPATRTRQRNPRGQGERLRDDIIEAASRLLADPAAPPLTLRAVARGWASPRPRCTCTSPTSSR